MFAYNKDIWSLYDDICIKTTDTHLVNIASVSFVNGNVMTDFFCQHHPRIWWFGAHGLPGQLSTEVSGIHWTPQKITTIFLPLTNCIEAWGVLELWQNVGPLRISVSCLLFGAPNRHDPFFEHVCGLLFLETWWSMMVILRHHVVHVICCNWDTCMDSGKWDWFPYKVHTWFPYMLSEFCILICMVTLLGNNISQLWKRKIILPATSKGDSLLNMLGSLKVALLAMVHWNMRFLVVSQLKKLWTAPKAPTTRRQWAGVCSDHFAGCFLWQVGSESKLFWNGSWESQCFYFWFIVVVIVLS